VPTTFPQPPADLDALALVQWSVATFGEDLALACSAGVEDSVLVHLAAQTACPVRVFLLDTGRLHPETHETFEALRRRYRPLRFEVISPDGAEVEKLVEAQGLFGFREGLEQRHACCEVRKLRPMRRALVGSRAWLTGLRREQSPGRADLRAAEGDGGTPERLKIAPLLDWDLPSLWAFVKEHEIPTHPLHEVGFPSIGCAPCTRAILPGEDLRAGRWWWEQPEHKECGLHNRPGQGLRA
jgi:phosphoadenosine phosphosulfate reductase